MNELIIPKQVSSEMSKKHKNRPEEWQRFARRMQKNPFVKDLVLNRDKVCQWCNGKITGLFVLHHKDYDHICQFEQTIIIKTPTLKRPTRERKDIPDCQSCKDQNPYFFNQCIQRVVAVHKGCNCKINDIQNIE